jgi:hypothetical protein
MIREQRIRPPTHGARIASGHLARYNVVAVAGDLSTARAVIEQLSRKGAIDADKISLTGSASVDVVTLAEGARADGRLLEYIGKHAMTGGAAGIVLGTMLAILLALIVMGTGAAGLLLAAVCGGIAGGILGTILSVFYMMEPSQPWGLTFGESDAGQAIVGVHSESREDIERAEQILRGNHLANVRRVGAT